MILSATKFKVRLTQLPRVKKDPKDPKSELVDYGAFTVGKKYTAYSVYSGKFNTQFLVADDTGSFIWIDTAIFKVK